MNRLANSHPEYRRYYLAVLLLTLTGLVDALYELYSHYQNYTNPVYSSFCAISKAINCDTVAQSPWSIMFGLPVALWGIFGYLSFLILLIPLNKKEEDARSLWSLLVIVGAIFSIVAVFLGYISSSKIHAYCILCLLSYVVSFSLFYLCWLIRRRFASSSIFNDFFNSIKIIFFSKFFKIAFAAIFVILILTICYIPHYWELSPTEFNGNLHHGVTQERYPWIGAVHPKLTIQEFSDYMCFQCRKMHYILRRLIQLYPNKIRLVRRNFPMDHQYNPLVTGKFHNGSGKMAIIAIYATIKGQFWKVNDLLFKIGGLKKNFNTRTIAKAMGVPVGEVTAALNNKSIRLMLKHDIAVGIKHGINGTPGFIIGGKVYLGTIPKGIIQKALAE